MDLNPEIQSKSSWICGSFHSADPILNKSENEQALSGTPSLVLVVGRHFDAAAPQCAAVLFPAQHQDALGAAQFKIRRQFDVDAFEVAGLDYWVAIQ